MSGLQMQMEDGGTYWRLLPCTPDHRMSWEGRMSVGGSGYEDRHVESGAD